ncbi:peptidyl-prolyl cis-trans isomerase [Paenibacillus sp. YPG26]|uniref:peptidylprolyl isomerase n=1 Tax=Paenibacillus sp. YPG26 TaxID=2878915 RepID=UPI00204209A8|nr:peptidyl-prolyl cis-trans isomerase [Paenibacillus sp. YPG26]USB32460.1 peptidyl-prolyl cis-trans isomerase [Paenibacillus sp. YPG26]
MEDKDQKNLGQGTSPETTEENTGVQVEASAAAPQTEAQEPAAYSSPDKKAYVTEQSAGGNPAVTAAKRQSLIWMVVSLILAVALVILLVKPLTEKSKADNAPVATVNGAEITKDKLYDELVKAGGAQTLDAMIDEELLKQEVTKANIKITDTDINKQIGYLEEQYGSKTALDQALGQNSMTRDDLKKMVVKQLELRKLLGSKIKVTDEEVKSFFDQNKESFNTPEQVRVSSITVATQAEADAILKQLKGGSDFAALAKEKSTDTATKSKGGDLGFFAKGQQDPAVVEAAFKLKKDELSGVVKSEAGFQILKLTDRKEAHTATLEERKDQIRDGLESQQAAQLQPEWLEETKAKAKIVNNLNTKTSGAAGAGATE